MMKIFFSPFFLRSFFLLTIISLCFTLFATTYLTSLKYSWFYQLSNEQLDRQAKQREDNAVLSIKQIIDSGSINRTINQHENDIDICAVMVTVPRMRR